MTVSSFHFSPVFPCCDQPYHPSKEQVALDVLDSFHLLSILSLLILVDPVKFLQCTICTFLTLGALCFLWLFAHSGPSLPNQKITIYFIMLIKITYTKFQRKTSHHHHHHPNRSTSLWHFQKMAVVRHKEAIHSGHFMVSNFEAEAQDVLNF